MNNTTLWQLSLPLAVSQQANALGIYIPASDFQHISDSHALAASPLLKEMQLSLLQGKLKKLADAVMPAILPLNNGKFAVLLAVDKDQVLLATENGNVSLALSTLQPLLGKTLFALRKTTERIYTEQDIPTEKGHWFWSVFGREMSVFNRVLIASFFANVLAILASFFSLQVYDRVVPSQSEETLWALLIGVLIAFALEATLRIVRSNLLDYSGKRIDVEVGSFLLNRLLGLRLKANSPTPNRLSQMMREFNSVREFFTEAAVGSFVDIPFAVLFLFIIYIIGGNVVWVAVIAMLLMIIPPLMFRGKMMKIISASLGARGAANRLFNEISYQLDTVKTNRAQPFFEKQWDDVSEIIADVSMRQRRLVTALSQWAMSLQQVAYVMTVTVAVYAVFAGELTIGAIIALNILVSRTLAPIARLSTLLIRWAQVKASLDELDLIAEGEQDDQLGYRKLRRPHLKGEFQVQNALYQYEKDTRPAVRIDKLVIRAGEKVAILGTNGSGKSTLLKLLSGIQFAQQGEIRCDGVDLRQIASRDVRQSISVVAQEIQLFNGTLRQNLTFGDNRISDEQIMQVLNQTGLAGFLTSHPYGLDLMIKDGGAGLSVGQKQSVQLARMLLSQSDILLLDEPTASLDPTVEAQVIQTLARFAEHKTLVLVTHRTPILAMVDRIIVMAEGQIIADGGREEILQRIQKAQQMTRVPLNTQQES